MDASTIFSIPFAPEPRFPGKRAEDSVEEPVNFLVKTAGGGPPDSNASQAPSGLGKEAPLRRVEMWKAEEGREAGGLLGSFRRVDVECVGDASPAFRGTALSSSPGAGSGTVICVESQ